MYSAEPLKPREWPLARKKAGAGPPARASARAATIPRPTCGIKLYRAKVSASHRCNLKAARDGLPPELADLKLEPKSEAEIDALMTAAAPAPAPAPDASSSDDDGAVDVQASSDDDDFDGRPALADANARPRAARSGPLPEARDGARPRRRRRVLHKARGRRRPRGRRAASLLGVRRRSSGRPWSRTASGAWRSTPTRAGAPATPRASTRRRAASRCSGRARTGDGAGVVDGAPGLRRFVKAVDAAAKRSEVIRGARDVVVARGRRCRAALNAVLNSDVKERPRRQPGGGRPAFDVLRLSRRVPPRP